MTQTENIDKVTIKIDKKSFTSQGVMMQYIAVNTRPLICVSVQLLAQVADQRMKDEFVLINKTIRDLKQTKGNG